jgi:hypothetical protein
MELKDPMWRIAGQLSQRWISPSLSGDPPHPQNPSPVTPEQQKCWNTMTEFSSTYKCYKRNKERACHCETRNQGK